MSSFSDLLEEFRHFLSQSIIEIKEAKDPYDPNIPKLKPGNSEYYARAPDIIERVRKLKTSRLNEIMSGINVDTSLPPHIKKLQDTLIDLLSEGEVGIAIDDTFMDFKDEIKRFRHTVTLDREYVNWIESHPDTYEALLFAYIKSINQEGGRRRTRQKSRRYRKKSKNTRRVKNRR